MFLTLNCASYPSSPFIQVRVEFLNDGTSDGVAICGGSLIATDLVLTSAACVWWVSPVCGDQCSYWVWDQCSYWVKDRCSYWVRDQCSYWGRNQCSYWGKDQCSYWVRRVIIMCYGILHAKVFRWRANDYDQCVIDFQWRWYKEREQQKNHRIASSCSLIVYFLSCKLDVFLLVWSPLRIRAVELGFSKLSSSCINSFSFGESKLSHEQ